MYRQFEGGLSHEIFVYLLQLSLLEIDWERKRDFSQGKEGIKLADQTQSPSQSSRVSATEFSELFMPLIMRMQFRREMMN